MASQAAYFRFIIYGPRHLSRKCSRTDRLDSNTGMYTGVHNRKGLLEYGMHNGAPAAARDEISGSKSPIPMSSLSFERIA